MESLSLRERRRALIEDDILRVAGDLLLEKGYSAMSMDELAARVGISKPTLYSFFSTKADLVIAASKSVMEEMLTEMNRVATMPEPAIDRLSHMLSMIISQHYAQGVAATVSSSPELLGLLHAHEETRRLKRSYADIVAALVKEASAEGQLADDLDAETVAVAFRGIVMSSFHCDPDNQPIQDALRLAQQLSMLFRRGISRDA